MRTILAAALAFTLVTATLVSAHTMHRSDVRHAQRMLSDLGYKTGPADGRIGPQTHTAIRDFQRDKNLSVNGKLDTETRAALEDAGKATSGTPPESR